MYLFEVDWCNNDLWTRYPWTEGQRNRTGDSKYPSHDSFLCSQQMIKHRKCGTGKSLPGMMKLRLTHGKKTHWTLSATQQQQRITRDKNLITFPPLFAVKLEDDSIGVFLVAIQKAFSFSRLHPLGHPFIRFCFPEFM